MKNSNSSAAFASPEAGFFGNIWQRWSDFWFAPIPATGLEVLRTLLGLLIVVWMLKFAGQEVAFLGLDGWFDDAAYKEADGKDFQAKQQPMPQSFLPVPIGWSVFFLAPDPQSLRAMYWLGVGIAVLFALGIASRITSVLTWIFVVSFTPNPVTAYDADFLLVLFTFYMMIASLFLGQANGNLSVLERILGPQPLGILQRLLLKSPPKETFSFTANFIVRLIQVHFAIIVMTSGLHKLQYGDWWSGTALWYPLHNPFTTTKEDLANLNPNAFAYLNAISLLQYLVLAWQISFPFFAWRAGWFWRTVTLVGGILGWIGSTFIFELPLFGPIYMLGCLSYLPPQCWWNCRQFVYEKLGR